MKIFLEIYSGDVNIQSGAGRILHPFPAGIVIHIAPESLFTSLRNDYSHAPEYSRADGAFMAKMTPSVCCAIVRLRFRSVSKLRSTAAADCIGGSGLDTRSLSEMAYDTVAEYELSAERH
jgi:hypothetical protein